MRHDPSEKRAGFANLQSCGLVWVCPVCNAKVMAERSIEIGAGIERWVTEEGGRIVFATWTVRHDRADKLQDLWALLRETWAGMCSGRAWQDDRELHGIEGHLRISECTHGCNGWHAHFHSIFFIAPGLVDDLGDLQKSMQDRWIAKARAAGGDALLVGQDWKAFDAADTEGIAKRLGRYFTKSQYFAKLGQELTNTQVKTARDEHGTNSTWEILHDARMGIDGARELWHAWEKGSHRQRQWTWSRGLRKRLGLGTERTEAEIAAEELGDATMTVAVISDDGWLTLLRRHLMVKALEATEAGGRAGLHDFLTRHGVDHEIVSLEDSVNVG